MNMVAIINYGMGNLFSVRQACEHVGLAAEITGDREAIAEAAGIILPGVGAFGDAMQALRRTGLDATIREHVSRQKPLLGICLGMQLLMERSAEFGDHEGLGLIQGDVVRLEPAGVKVPQVGWNRCHRPPSGTPRPLWEGVADDAWMYFVHSYYVRPADPALTASETVYGRTRFCSSLHCGCIWACQFHPERSGAAGLMLYKNFAGAITAPATLSRA